MDENKTFDEINVDVKEVEIPEAQIVPTKVNQPIAGGAFSPSNMANTMANMAVGAVCGAVLNVGFRALGNGLIFVGNKAANGVKAFKEHRKEVKEKKKAAKEAAVQEEETPVEAEKAAENE